MKNNCERIFLKPFLSAGLPNCFGLIGPYALVFVSKFTVLFTNSPFPTDTAVIRSSVLAILCKVSVLTNFPKFTREHLRFLMKFQIYRVFINFIKKEISARMFSCEFCEISHSTFFNEPFGWLLLPKDSFCLLFHHYFCLFKPDIPHIVRLSIFLA